MLPVLRFLVGVVHAEQQAIPLQDYALPGWLRPEEGVLAESAQALQSLGYDLPATLVEWITHVWFEDRT